MFGKNWYRPLFAGISQPTNGDSSEQAENMSLLVRLSRGGSYIYFFTGDEEKAS